MGSTKRRKKLIDIQMAFRDWDSLTNNYSCFLIQLLSVCVFDKYTWYIENCKSDRQFALNNQISAD